MADTSHVLILTTLPAGADATAFATSLVEARLAACVNLLPVMESIYRWEGRVQQDSERQLIIKTSRERVATLWQRVRELHPYDVPEYIVLPIVDGDDAYLRWLGEATRTPTA
jgi:periplasmic divalent cation tolerance protein